MPAIEWLAAFAAEGRTVQPRTTRSQTVLPANRGLSIACGAIWITFIFTQRIFLCGRSGTRLRHADLAIQLHVYSIRKRSTDIEARKLQHHLHKRANARM
jgi:hypothetical protein